MIKFDLVNVIDVEATCYPENVFPEGETQEIIEIGVAVVDTSRLEIVGTDQIVLRNRLSRVSEYCTELTGWTEEKLREMGVEYGEACRMLRSHHDSRSRLWVSQGCGDRRLFEKQCGIMEIPYPFAIDHLDLSHMLALLTGRVRRVGLKKAMRLFGMEFEGRQHSGKDDAYNTARYLIEILKRGNFKL